MKKITPKNKPRGNRPLRKTSAASGGRKKFLQLADWVRSKSKSTAGSKPGEEADLPVQWLPRILFVFLLALFYIANNHYANRINFEISKLKNTVNDLRVDYTGMKADYMSESKQSSVAKRMISANILESSTPPQKIVVKDVKTLDKKFRLKKEE